MDKLVLDDIKLLNQLAGHSMHHFEIDSDLRSGIKRLWCRHLVSLAIGDRWEITVSGELAIRVLPTIH